MPVTDPAELKRQLRAAGFEIYRTAENQIQLAERVRDNLIMDSGVAAEISGAAFAIRVTVRAQASHYPGADEGQLWSHARQLAQVFVDDGFEEQGSRSEPVPDPSDPDKHLDTSHEVLLSRAVDSLEALCDQLRTALGRRRSTNDD